MVVKDRELVGEQFEPQTPLGELGTEVAQHINFKGARRPSFLGFLAGPDLLPFVPRREGAKRQTPRERIASRR